MVKNVFLISLFFLGALCYAQAPSYNQKLYYTCKFWGFVKYYHSEVSVCNINWDSVLISRLPQIKNSVSKDEFNDILDSMLVAAGPMSIAMTSFPDTLSPILKRNRDWTWWVNDTMIRADIKILLDTIRNNFRPHPICHVDYNYICCNNPNYGALAFQYDYPMINTNTYTNFPDEWNRLMALFKYWNVIKYFNPYNYVTDVSWDSTLFSNVLGVANAPDGNELYKVYKKILAGLNDAHVEDFTYRNPPTFLGYYAPMLKLKHVEGKYIIVKSGYVNLRLGDEIVSVNGMTPQQWEDSLRPYTSYGDSIIFRRFVGQNILAGPINTSLSLVWKDSIGVNHAGTASRQTYIPGIWYTGYPTDSLQNFKWRKWGCNVGYVNLNRLLPSDVNAMYADLQNTDAIIFEHRRYSNSSAWSVCDLLLPNSSLFAKFMLPDVSYPGTYYWASSYIGLNGNPTSYSGQVIVLMDEWTQSEGEFNIMALETHPNLIKVGSHTAGTDGNLTFLKPSLDVNTAFTSYGVFYPNGDSTQRVGIIPDSLVLPTQLGIRWKRDEVLEKALQIAGCPVSTNSVEYQTNQLSVYPNPTFDFVTVKFDLSLSLSGELILFDILGKEIQKRTLENSTSVVLDLSELDKGLYFLQWTTSKGCTATKIVKY